MNVRACDRRRRSGSGQGAGPRYSVAGDLDESLFERWLGVPSAPRQRDAHGRLRRREPAVDGAGSVQALGPSGHDERHAGPSATAETIRSSSGSDRASGGHGGSPQTSRRTSRQAPGPWLSGHHTSGSSRRSAAESSFVASAGDAPAARTRALRGRGAARAPGILERRANEPDIDLAAVELFDVEHGRPQLQFELHLGISRSVGIDDRARNPPVSERVRLTRRRPR